MPSFFIKDPASVVDYRYDFAALTNGSGPENYLDPGETIITRVITAATGITVDSSSITDTGTSVTVWLSGGTAGQQYSVACKITTSASRTDERTIRIAVQDQ